jgi:hypothetical protein
MSVDIAQSKRNACIAAGFEVKGDTVWAYGRKFPLTNPLAIHLNVYRKDESHETRYQAMKAAFDILWPEQRLTYNYWMERMFREHCNHDTETFSIAGGAGLGKSQTCAYIAILFWLALPHERAVMVTSTTLSSLKSRIYGYIVRALNELVIKVPYLISNTPPPSIRISAQDSINGIFGIAAKHGTAEQCISEIKGRHPKNAVLLILDEATDMPPGILDAIPNLRKGLEDRLQVIAIGNSTSTTDLHGALSTPFNGWDSINPAKDFRWKTTQPNGICLYFNPYDSPAIHEPDPFKKAALSKFMMTAESLLKAEREEGTESEGFWKFTMGFWRSRSTDKTVVSEAFLKDYDPTRPAEFSGKVPLVVVAGLDPAFSVGGDKCILRLAVLGHHVNGKMILDFRGESFVFPLKIQANTGKSAEIQIADQTIHICAQYGVALNTLCIDASGAGRGLADVIQLRSGGGLTPTKIYSTNLRKSTAQTTFDVVISSAYEMWFKGREFISNSQIFGLDAMAYGQLHTRLIEDKNGKKELEKKDVYKRRMSSISSLLGRSPDEADAAMLAVQSAALHHGFFPGQTVAVKQYANEMSRAIDVATQAYKTRNVKDFVLRATYSTGIESIINKKMF